MGRACGTYRDEDTCTKGCIYSGADKSLAQPTSRCILFDGENISFVASLAIYITNTPPIMIINRIYKNQNLLSL
jgi:homoserine trans-succinylase